MCKYITCVLNAKIFGSGKKWNRGHSKVRLLKSKIVKYLEIIEAQGCGLLKFVTITV